MPPKPKAYQKTIKKMSFKKDSSVKPKRKKLVKPKVGASGHRGVNRQLRELERQGLI